MVKLVTMTLLALSFFFSSAALPSGSDCFDYLLFLSPALAFILEGTCMLDLKSGDSLRKDLLLFSFIYPKMLSIKELILSRGTLGDSLP